MLFNRGYSLAIKAKILIEMERERHNVKRGHGLKKQVLIFSSQVFLWNMKRRICGECSRDGEGLLMCLSLKD